MKQTLIACALLMLACTINASAQTYNSKSVERYIDRYRSLAMSEQQRTGIPAAIKLAQGIHETGAGTSKLAVEANNHFGLKCKNGWTGGTYAYTDDAPNECFRKYNMDFESYQDQSNYLKANPRYAALFNLSVTDYAAWAIGLRKAGYATNPKYSEMLIKIIEEYKLQEYTYAAMGNNGLNSDNVAMTPPVNNNYSNQQQSNYGNSNTTYNNNNYQQPAQNNNANVAVPPTNANVQTINTAPPQRTSKYIDTRPRERQTMAQTQQPNGQVTEQRVDNAPFNISKVNNLKAVYGKRGDMPLQYAVRAGIRYEKFLEMNDLKEEPLVADMPLYLERKHFWGLRSMHLVKPGETMLVIAQKEGMQLKYLRDLNFIEEDEEPMPGVTLELQAQAGTKPPVQKREEALASYQQNIYEAQNANEPPVRTFPKNPAPVHEEEKPLWDKMKEAKKIRKEEKELQKQIAAGQQPQQTVYTAPPPQQQATTNNIKPNPAATYYNNNQQATASQQQPAASYNSGSKYINNTQENVTPNPAAQNYNNSQPAARTYNNSQPQQVQQPVQTYSRSEYSYSNTGNVTPNPAAQNYSNTQPATARTYNNTPQQPLQVQQPVQTYSRSEYSYSNTGNVTPNPAAQVEEEDTKRSRRNRKKDQVQQPAVAAPQPQQQKPKNELDALKEQFDNVIYANNNVQPVQNRNVQQQPAQQQSYQQPANTYAQQQEQTTAYERQPQQQAYNQQQAPQAAYNDPGKIYTVKRGDTAYTIAKKHGITIRQLMDWNGLDFDAIKEGQTLRVKQ